eukprot:gene17285-19703_t
MFGITGSMANQKYEINKRIQRHIKEIKDPVPSYDVVRWKDAVHAPTKPVGSNLQTDMLHEKKVQQRNVELSNRLFSIMKENREARSYQYAPGWRAGLDGAVIDCYPSHNHTLTKNQFLHNAKTMRALHDRQLEEKNQLFLKHINEQKSSYLNEDLRKDYAESRRIYKIYKNRTNPTEMHLGLYTRARKDLQAKEREYAKILARRAEKAARSVDGDEADEQIYFRSPSQSPSPSPTNGRPRSHSTTPGSAPRASSKASSPSKAAQKLHEAVGRADTAGARIEYQAAAVQHDLRASAEGGWNSSTNDNVLNSSHNPGRPHSAYDTRRAYAPAFNKVLDTVAKSKEDGAMAAKVRPKSSTGIGRADPKKVTTQSAQPTPERHEHKQDKQVKAERMEKLAKSAEFIQSAAATERPASPKKLEFTLYDVKEKTREFFHYPAGSFRNTGDLIDFQALAVQQSVKQGNTKPRAQSAHHAASKPIGVFPGVENGPEWVKFPKSEELTRSYSESKGLTSPGRSRSMKKLSAMRKNVSFGAQSNAAKEVTAERTPSPVALQRALTGQISPKNISPRPLSRNR